MYSTCLYMNSKFQLQYTIGPQAATDGPFVSSLYDYVGKR